MIADMEFASKSRQDAWKYIQFLIKLYKIHNNDKKKEELYGNTVYRKKRTNITASFESNGICEGSFIFENYTIFTVICKNKVKQNVR